MMVVHRPCSIASVATLYDKFWGLLIKLEKSLSNLLEHSNFA